MTVYANPRCHKMSHTVSFAVDREACPAIDSEEKFIFPVCYGEKSAVIVGVWVGANYSHSIVPGGFEVISYVTRLMPRTSLMIRVAVSPRKAWLNG